MLWFLSSCMAYISSFCRLKVERELPLCARYRPTLTKRKTPVQKGQMDTFLHDFSAIR